MTSPRAYAAQRTAPEAVAELRRCAGSQFDPAVVDALAKVVADAGWPQRRAATADELDAAHGPA
jgi:HD-GYP domain-containing protein (c-di-GMP phosphodiesterase class II)